MVFTIASAKPKSERSCRRWPRHQRASRHGHGAGGDSAYSAFLLGAWRSASDGSRRAGVYLQAVYLGRRRRGPLRNQAAMRSFCRHGIVGRCGLTGVRPVAARLSNIIHNLFHYSIVDGIIEHRNELSAAQAKWEGSWKWQARALKPAWPPVRVWLAIWRWYLPRTKIS